MCNKIQYKFLYILIGILFCINKVFALTADSQQDMTIEANSATFDYNTKVGTFAGNIIIKRGSIVIKANSGTASVDQDNNKYVILNGDPVTFYQQQDDNTIINGQGNNLSYDTKTNLLILSSKARIKKASDIIIGQKIIYNTKTNQYSVNSGIVNNNTASNNNRVTIILDRKHLNDASLAQ